MKPIMLRVVKIDGKGLFAPADRYSEETCRDAKYAVGQTYRARLSRARNPKFHRLAFAIAKLVSENIESFEGLDSYHTMKRLQIESGVECDELAIKYGGQTIPYRIARSLAFDNMPDEDFHTLIRAICKHICHEYWPDCDVDEIISMAEEQDRA